MRNIKWKIIALSVTVILLCGTPAFTQGLSGWLNIISDNSSGYQDGKRTSDSSTLNQNYFLNFEKPVTPVLVYHIYLRSNLIDSRITDSAGETTTTYRRMVEPTLDLLLQNPVYDLTAGYRRQEEWTTAHLRDESRETTELYYSRFNLVPASLPSLSINVDRLRNFDYLSVSKIDRTNDEYAISSTYELPSRDVRFRYVLNYSHNIDRDKASIIEKTVNDNFSGNYNIGYTGALLRDMASYSLLYQGNYSRNKSRQTFKQTGTVISKRTSLGGWHKHDGITQDLGTLNANGLLVDEDFNASAGIDIGGANPTNKLHNTGISASSQKTVDRLFIYVSSSTDPTGDSLDNAGNWSVFRSNFNQQGTWSEVTVKDVKVTAFDRPNNIYIFEIEFLGPQGDSFYKAVNNVASNIGSVLVTEIEAYGTDDIGSKTSLDVFTSFEQGLNFDASARPFTPLTVSLNYSLHRSDQNPVSLTNSLRGVFENIYSDSLPDNKSNFRSTISRNYGIGATWLTHRYLTTIARYQKSQNFDDREETDTEFDSYNISFNSVPLPTLDTTLSYTRTIRYNFDKKDSTTDSYLLSLGSRLYKNINMITDLGYNQTDTISTNTTTSTYSINGTVDARVTRQVSSILNYNLSRITSDDNTTDSKNALIIVNYQPGRSINISGNVNYFGSEESKTTSEGLSVDWLPLPAIRLNMNYLHSNTDPKTSKTDSINGYGIWYITKFADVRLSSGYSKTIEDIKTENYNFNANLNVRF
ncbi:MAG: hypothetical protein HZB61_00515 [Nitrospirae bacterium]|nr:hypothetical protein [Nitrospirota bacterium]